MNVLKWRVKNRKQKKEIKTRKRVVVGTWEVGYWVLLIVFFPVYVIFDSWVCYFFSCEIKDKQLRS